MRWLTCRKAGWGAHASGRSTSLPLSEGAPALIVQILNPWPCTGDSFPVQIEAEKAAQRRAAAWGPHRHQNWRWCVPALLLLPYPSQSLDAGASFLPAYRTPPTSKLAPLLPPTPKKRYRDVLSGAPGGDWAKPPPVWPPEWGLGRHIFRHTLCRPWPGRYLRRTQLALRPAADLDVEEVKRACFRFVDAVAPGGAFKVRSPRLFTAPPSLLVFVGNPPSASAFTSKPTTARIFYPSQLGISAHPAAAWAEIAAWWIPAQRSAEYRMTLLFEAGDAASAALLLSAVVEH